MKRTKSLLIASLDGLEYDSLIPKSRISTVGCRLKRGVIVELAAHRDGDGFAVRVCFDTEESDERKGFELEHLFDLTAMPSVTITHEAFVDISDSDSDDMMSEIVSAALSRSCRVTLERIRGVGKDDTIRIDLCSKGYSSSVDVSFSKLADFLVTARLPGEPR